MSETKAKQFAGELVEVDQVETFWRGKLRSFRALILSIGDRLRHLPAKGHVRLMAELRAALSELSAGQPQEELSAG